MRDFHKKIGAEQMRKFSSCKIEGDNSCHKGFELFLTPLLFGYTHWKYDQGPGYFSGS